MLESQEEINQDDSEQIANDVRCGASLGHWSQLSLKTVIICFVLGSGLIGFMGTTWHRFHTEAKVVTTLINLGADVHYDYEYFDGEFTENSMPPGPAWLRQRLGQNYFAR